MIEPRTGSRGKCAAVRLIMLPSRMNSKTANQSHWTPSTLITGQSGSLFAGSLLFLRPGREREKWRDCGADVRSTPEKVEQPDSFSACCLRCLSREGKVSVVSVLLPSLAGSSEARRSATEKRPLLCKTVARRPA